MKFSELGGMVKKKQNKLKIDYEKCIIEDRLLQIKNQAYVNDLKLVKVWTIEISPKDSPKVLVLVRQLSSQDPVSLVHLKRIQPIDGMLHVVLCSTEWLEESQIALKLSNMDFNYNNLCMKLVPGHCPGTKELSQDWGKKYWPLVWKGNPNDQILNDVKIDISLIKNHLDLIHSLSVDSTKQGLPIITCIVNPLNNQLLATTRDLRHIHPLKHSIMQCIETVSQDEQRKRGEDSNSQHYLCYGYHVYTTHEPCSMCAMALIHSRVSRLIYLKSMPSTGASKPSSGEGYTIHDHKLLNSRFEVWEWTGDEYKDVPGLKDINA